MKNVFKIALENDQVLLNVRITEVYYISNFQTHSIKIRGFLSLSQVKFYIGEYEKIQDFIILKRKCYEESYAMSIENFIKRGVKIETESSIIPSGEIL